MNKKIRNYLYLIGGILVLLGMYLSIFQKEPHFYTFFSLGFLIIFYNIYQSIKKEKLLRNKKEFLLFSVILLVECILIDQVGMYLGYWTYQYTSFFDNLIKYIFEWAIPFVYSMLLLMTGKEIFKKKFNERTSFVLSLLIFITLFGLFTEYINLFSDSWIVLDMPISNYKVGEFFVVFQTIGYWLISFIPWITYKMVKRIC